MSLLTTNTAASSHRSKAANLFLSPVWKTPPKKSPNYLIKMYQSWKLLIQNIESLTFSSFLIKQNSFNLILMCCLQVLCTMQGIITAQLFHGREEKNSEGPNPFGCLVSVQLLLISPCGNDQKKQMILEIPGFYKSLIIIGKIISILIPFGKTLRTFSHT